VDVAALALFADEFLPPRAPRFLSALLGIATPVEICARIAFSVGAAGDGIGAAAGLTGAAAGLTGAAAGLTGAAALITLAGPLLRAVCAVADAGRGTRGLAAGAGGVTAGTTRLGVAATASFARSECEEEEADEDTDETLLSDEDVDDEATEDDEDPDSELESDISTARGSTLADDEGSGTCWRWEASDVTEEPEDSEDDGCFAMRSVPLLGADAATASVLDTATLGFGASLTRCFLEADTFRSALP
jgi:hypothetical protein